MDSALACCAGSQGLIPAIDKSKKKFAKLQMVFPPSCQKVVGHENGARLYNLSDLESPLK